MKKIKITERQAKMLGLSKEPKNTLKITQEQYDRIFGDKILKENSVVRGGETRIDKFFKGVTEDEIETVPFDNQDLKHRNFPSNIDRFGKPLPIFEQEADMSNEIDGLIKHLYDKSNELSEFWEQNGLNCDKICLELMKKGLIEPKGDNYAIKKTHGDTDATKQAIADVLTPLMSKEEELTEEGGPDDDYRNPDQIPVKEVYKVVAMNDEMAILKNNEKNQLFAFYYRDDIENIKKVVANSFHHDNLDDTRIDKENISYYVNDANQGITNILNNNGEGLTDYEGTEFSPIKDEVNIILIDEELKEHLLSIFEHNPEIVNVLTSEINEAKDLVGHVKDITTQSSGKRNFSPEEIAAKLKKQRETSQLQDIEADQEHEAGKLPYLDKEEIEETTAGTGAYTGLFSPKVDVEESLIKRKLQEMTQGSDSVGEVTKNGLPDIGRNGEFKKGKKPKAFKTPQWAGGTIIGNENSDGSVISPSLDENKIYETIAAKTGKTIEEVKRIIKSKNGKA